MLADTAQMFLAVELSLLFLAICTGVSLIRQKISDEKIQQMQKNNQAAVIIP
ncbi:MAG: hypothetical protein ACRAUW_11055 [Aeromonas sp.]|uniref:hypothetical protein n=1 Tax=Aeromonas sp. TaxID=647 RepID=UPI003D6B2730